MIIFFWSSKGFEIMIKFAGLICKINISFKIACISLVHVLKGQKLELLRKRGEREREEAN